LFTKIQGSLRINVVKHGRGMEVLLVEEASHQHPHIQEIIITGNFIQFSKGD
jgi:hypothetical protein